MFSLLPGRLGRYGAVLVALLLLSVPVLAHEGHDHGAAQAAPAAPANPRVAMSSDIYEAVAVLRGDRLTVYLDRFGSNDPVTDAKLVVTLGGEGEIPADLGAAATYVVASPKLAGSGPLEILLAVTGPAGE